MGTEWMHILFVSPWFLSYLVSVVVFLVVLLFLSRARRDGKNLTHVTVGRWLLKFSRTRNIFWRIFLSCFTLFLIVFGSVFVLFDSLEEDTAIANEHIEGPVVLVIADISSSVRSPSSSEIRLMGEAYRKIIETGLPTGLIIFSESAYLARIPTRDKDVLLASGLDSATVSGMLDDLPGSTNTAAALSLAQRFFEENFKENPKIIVLLSDLDDKAVKVVPALEDLEQEISPLSFYIAQFTEFIRTSSEWVKSDLARLVRIDGMVSVRNDAELPNVDTLIRMFADEEGSGTPHAVFRAPNPFPDSDRWLFRAAVFGATICFSLLFAIREIFIPRVN